MRLPYCCYRVIAVIAVLVCAAPLLAVARPLILEEVAKITPPGPSDQLLNGVAVSGNHLVLNTRRNFQGPNYFESEQFTYLYTRDSAGVWTHTATLNSLRHPHLAEVRVSSSVYADIAAVQVGQPTGGRLMIFERAGLQWLQTASLESTATGIDIEFDGGRIIVSGRHCSWLAFRKEAADWRAFASGSTLPYCTSEQDVDMSGEIVAVSDFGLPVSGQQFEPSKVHMFHGLSSQHPAAIVLDPLSSQPGQFGFPVAMGGFTMFAGRVTRPFEGGLPEVFAFERATDDVWRRVANFKEPDAAQLLYISSMDAQHGRVAVGYPLDSSRVIGGGSAAVYQRASNGTYSAGVRLFASDAFETDHLTRHQFGTHVDIDGRTVAATARSAVYVFQLPSTLKDAELIQDDFQDGNSAGWTPARPTWAIATVDGSRVYQQQDAKGTDSRSIFSNVVGNNQAVEVQARPIEFSGDDRWFGAIARYVDSSNFYYLSVRSSNRVLLRKRRDGIFLDLDEAAMPVALNRTYRLRIEAIGTRIRGYVDGQLMVEAVDRDFSRGRPGLVTSAARTNFDNVVITPSHVTTLFADNFEGQFVHTAWHVGSGEWVHASNPSFSQDQDQYHYAQTSTSGKAEVVAGVNTTDQVIEIEASAPAALPPSSSYGALARYRDARNFYYLGIGSDNRVSLRRQLNGAAVVLDSAPLVHQAGQRYTLRLEALGSQLRGYVNGRLILEARDTTHRAGIYGLATYKAAADFHDVLVTQP